MSDISCLASSLPVYFAFIGHTDVLIKQTLSDFWKELVTSIVINRKRMPFIRSPQQDNISVPKALDQKTLCRISALNKGSLVGKSTLLKPLLFKDEI